MKMSAVFLKKLKESVVSILPIALIVVVLSLIFVPNCGWTVFNFAICAILLMLGICLFNIGCEMSLMKMGEYVGSHLSKTKKVLLMLICSLLIGAVITIAEPDLKVLASQVDGLDDWILLIATAIGVGVFLMLAIARVLLKIKIKYILAVSYLIILILMFFVDKRFLPICFDASGVTTGPLSVPFIMAFGLGIVTVMSGKKNRDDEFGFLAMCSIGPIFAVMILSVILSGGLQSAEPVTYEVLGGFGQMMKEMGSALLTNIWEVAIILLPIVAFFMVYQVSALKLPWKNILRLMIGVLFAYVGITLFFTGVSAGFLPIANILSMTIASSSSCVQWLLIPICFVVGLFLAIAEPAVHVLTKQVEDLSNGAITKKTMLLYVSAGVSISIVLAILRIFFKIDILYIYVPLVALMIILTFFIPNHITAIAFDSGGVATGSMSSSFVLPFMKGVCQARGLDTMTYGFGTIGIVILVPIVLVEIMGLRIAINEKRYARNQKLLDESKEGKVSIIEFD